MLRSFWRELTDVVHPADQAVFDANPHSFNLEYPPPAFVGDPAAPVVVLYANGGYDPVLTPQEFADPGAAGRYREQLHGLSSAIPSYYRGHAMGDWLEAGLAVRVNAVAYRSKRLSEEPTNQALVDKLPSVALHRRWILEEVLPQALAGDRFLIVHRNGAWRLDRSLAGPTVAFSSNPISASPSKEPVERVRQWLVGRGQLAAMT
ncbi:MAG TPA: hypothetical protein VGH86_08550 [Phenylobacterium sp.]|jgi:hypothetical protein